MQLKLKKRAIATDTSLINSSLIEVFGCLHKHADVFLHNWANAIWSLKGLERPYLSTLVIFLRQKFSITLQRMQASFILSWAIIIGLTTSWLPPLQNTPPITVTDLLQCRRFLTYKYGRPSTSGRLWTWRDFHTYFELTWHLVTCPFSLIFLLCTFS
jgi:hypothetical protein